MLFSRGRAVTFYGALLVLLLLLLVLLLLLLLLLWRLLHCWMLNGSALLPGRGHPL
jgi:hypothetical protein